MAVLPYIIAYFIGANIFPAQIEFDRKITEADATGKLVAVILIVDPCARCAAVHQLLESVNRQTTNGGAVILRVS